MLRNPGWHLLIVWYFFLGGIAGGAYFTAAIADNFGGARDRGVIRIGYVLALLLVMVCGILLILDLGVPARFLNMLGAFKFWDPMSIGAWMLGVFGLFAFVSSALSLGGGESAARLRRRVSLLGTIAGFFLAAYTGVLLSNSALAVLERRTPHGSPVPRLRGLDRDGGHLAAPPALGRGGGGGFQEDQARRPLRDDLRADRARRCSSLCSGRQPPPSRPVNWPRCSGAASSCSGCSFPWRSIWWEAR